MNSTEHAALITQLRSQNKTHLADALAGILGASAKGYMVNLANKLTGRKRAIDPLFLECVHEHLCSTGHKSTTADQVAKQIEEAGWLQTTPHMTVVQIPRMLTISWLTSLATPDGAPTAIASCSALPFSNSYGASEFWTEHTRQKVVPAKMQDRLVWRATMPDKPHEVWSSTPEMQRWFPDPAQFERYTDWLRHANSAFESKLIGRTIVHIDINEIVARYLARALAEPRHPIASWWKTLPANHEHYPKVAWFLAEYSGKRRTKMEKLYLQADGFAGRHNQVPFGDAANHCPGGWLTYTLLEAFAGISTLGSFIHAEYLPRYSIAWQKLDLINNHSPDNRLTTGQSAAVENKNAIDWLESGTTPDWNPDEPILDIIMRSRAAILDDYWLNELTTLEV